MTRVIVLSDVHGNAIALEAVREAIRTEKPDLVAIAGDLVLNGPDPAGHGRPAARDGGRRRGDHQRQHRHRGRRLRLCRRVPVDDRRRARTPSGRPPNGRTTRSATSGSRWLRRLPVRAPPARRGRHDDPRLPRLARLADGRLRPGARPERHHRARRRGPTRGSSPAGTPTCPRSATSAGSSSSTTARPATSSTASRPRRGRGSTSTTARSRPRSSAPNSTPSPSPTRSPPAASPGDVYRAATVRTGKLVR